MLLIVAQLPFGEGGDPQEAHKKAAALCGLAPVDVATRLGGTLPRSLLSDASAARVDELRRGLAALGYGTFACDPAQAPSDAQRVHGRRLGTSPQGLLIIDRGDDEHLLPRAALRLVQRGVRVNSTTSTQQVTEKKFSVGMAALTGGLVTRKSVERTVTQQSESREAFLLLHRGDGEPDVILYERRLDYRFLGSKMGPASMGNLAATLDWLREWAPEVKVDDRVGRPGFVKGLPQTAADAVDLALYAVRLTHAV